MNNRDKDLSDKIKQMREQNSPAKRKKQLDEHRQFALDKFNNRPKDQK
jgi:hypothetical protein